MIVMDTIWLKPSNGGVVGFVLVQNDEGAPEVYCGPGIGMNEAVDASTILHRAAQLNVDQAEQIYRHLAPEMYIDAVAPRPEPPKPPPDRIVPEGGETRLATV